MNLIKKNFSTSLIFKFGIASVDQAMISALNLLISIILIKTASKVEYGYYSIAFSISLFLISIQNAIVNAPLAVLLVSKKNAMPHRFATVSLSLSFQPFALGLLPAQLFVIGG